MTSYDEPATFATQEQSVWISWSQALRVALETQRMPASFPSLDRPLRMNER